MISTGAAAQAAGPGSIDGHVVDSVLHQPLAGAVITVDGASQISDGDGHFEFVGLREGSHVIDVILEGFHSKQVVVVVEARLAIEIDLDSASGEVVIIEGESKPPPEMHSSSEISGEELDKTRGRSFGDALANVPGVSSLGSSSGLAKPIIRGQFGRRLLILVDSVRHRSQDWGIDHAPEIDPFSAGSLTVVRGASGVRYGPDAVAGAILVEPPQLLRSPGAAMEAHLIGHSRGGAGVASRLQVASLAVPGLSWQLDGSAHRLSAPKTPDYALDNTGSLEWSAGARAGYRHGDGIYELYLRHYQAQLGVCLCLRIEASEDFFEQLDRDRPIDAELYESRSEIERPRQSTSHELALARGRWSVGRFGDLTATYAFQFDHREEFEVVRTADGAQFDFQLTTHDLEIALRHKPIHVTDHHHVRGEAGVVAMAQVHQFGGLTLVPDHRAGSGGLYAIERLLGHDFEIEAGLRFEFMGRTASLARRDFLRLVRSDQLEADGCGDASGDIVDCDSSFVTLSASVGGAYQFATAWTAKLELSTTSRPPNPDEQYLNGTSPTFPVLGLGKPDLGAENAYAGSATITHQSERLATEASAYASYTRNYIEFAPALDENGQSILDVLIRGSFPRFVTRPVDALFYGLDGGARWHAASFLELGAQLSMVRARNLTSDSFLAFIPPDRGRISAKISGASLGFSNAYAEIASTVVRRQNRFDRAVDLASPPDAYALVDASVGVARAIGDQSIDVAINGTNLTNARYRDYTSLLRYFADQPGWQLMFRVSVRASATAIDSE